MPHHSEPVRQRATTKTDAGEEDLEEAEPVFAGVVGVGKEEERRGED